MSHPIRCFTPEKGIRSQSLIIDLQRLNMNAVGRSLPHKGIVNRGSEEAREGQSRTFVCVEIKVEVKLRRDGSMYDINHNTTKRNGVHTDSNGAHVCCVIAEVLWKTV